MIKAHIQTIPMALAMFLPPLAAGGFVVQPGVWIILGILLAVTLAALLARRAWQRAKGVDLPEDFGFQYDPAQNLFYSEQEAWQRQFGYCQLYDEAAVPLGMVIDCEPVRFDYGGRRWLIELWKGQYGLTTGAEVGIYSTDGPDLAVPGVFDGTFYGDTDTELPMSMQLYKNNRPLFTRGERHWWLTGFVLGEFSQPHELSLRVRLQMPDSGMLQAFVQALRELGYTDEELRYGGTSVFLTVTTPRSKQPAARSGELEQVMQSNNRRMCEAYRDAVGGLTTGLEQLEKLRGDNPALYRRAVRATRSSQALYRPYRAIRKYLPKK